MPTTIELLEKQISEIINLRTLASAETPVFKQWQHVTIAIIEREFGKKKAADFPTHSVWPNHIGPWNDKELKASLLKGLDIAEAYLNALIQEAGVRGEEPPKRLSPR